CARAAAAAMPAQGGAVVNTASIMGLSGAGPYPNPAYHATKGALVNLTRSQAVEWAPRGIRVNAVAPSIAMHANLAKVTTDELLAELTSREAFGRAAEPWEVANVIVFLASDYSTYMTGEVLSVSSQHP
ncbi:MAG: SDR family oxidoreductase, partial [Actinomycetota bacterium]